MCHILTFAVLSRDDTHHFILSATKVHKQTFLFRTSLFIIMSFIYAKLLVVVCITYVISEVVTHKLPLYYYEGFFTYLYGMSILFLLYVFCFLLQESACCARGSDTPPPPPRPPKTGWTSKEAKDKNKKKDKKEKDQKQPKSKKETQVFLKTKISYSKILATSQPSRYIYLTQFQLMF